MITRVRVEAIGATEASVKQTLIDGWQHMPITGKGAYEQEQLQIFTIKDGWWGSLTMRRCNPEGGQN